jgi:hypothetical protein
VWVGRCGSSSLPLSLLCSGMFGCSDVGNVHELGFLFVLATAFYERSFTFTLCTENDEDGYESKGYEGWKGL